MAGRGPRPLVTATLVVAGLGLAAAPAYAGLALDQRSSLPGACRQP